MKKRKRTCMWKQDQHPFLLHILWNNAELLKRNYFREKCAAFSGLGKLCGLFCIGNNLLLQRVIINYQTLYCSNVTCYMCSVANPSNQNISDALANGKILLRPQDTQMKSPLSRGQDLSSQHDLQPLLWDRITQRNPQPAATAIAFSPA